MAKWLWRWACHPEALSSIPSLTTNWLPTGSPTTSWDS